MTTSAQSSALNSPQGRERATSTFSTTFGLAKLLNERGISAAIPRVISRPPSPSHAYSPTATPCNSPEGSPPPSPPPFSPLKIPSIMTLGSSMCRGSDLLRKRKSATARTKQNKRAPTKTTSSAGNYTVSASRETNVVSSSSLASINLLDKLNRIGLENIMSTSVSQKPPLPPAVAAVPPSSHSLAALPFVNRTSPMAQLTSIRRLTGSTSPLSINTKIGPVQPSLATLTTTTNTVMASSCIASTQELGTIGTLSSLRKGGLSL